MSVLSWPGPARAVGFVCFEVIPGTCKTKYITIMICAFLLSGLPPLKVPLDPEPLLLNRQTSRSAPLSLVTLGRSTGGNNNR